MRRSSACCLARELGLAASESALGPRDGHALSGAHPQQVDLKLREGGEDVVEHLAYRIGRVVDLPAEGESDAAGGEVVTDAAGVGH
jgi:hypothetical protein